MPGLALLSGGLDSTVAATHAARHGGLALALTIDYDQRSRERETAAAASIAAFLEIEHRVLRVPFLKRNSESALLDRDREIPAGIAEDLDESDRARERARQVWVPNRNGLFINIAACFAQAGGMDRIVVGFNQEEAATFPDNSREFLEASNRALGFSLSPQVRVESPTLSLDKTGIVRLGLEEGAPLHLIWSCYEEGPGHCFRCESCQRLKRALMQAGAWEQVGPRLEIRP